MAYEYDVCVIGAGPGGYETAIKAAQMGKKTCIIEGKYYGGTCLNVGCIPTKTLIQSAELFSHMKEAASFAVNGVDPAALSVDMAKLQKRKTKRDPACRRPGLFRISRDGITSCSSSRRPSGGCGPPHRT